MLGTALTPEQARRLAGFCSELELIFDGDAPGRKAALRACEMALSKGLSCKVVLLPEKEDIDSLLQEKGPDAFEELRRFSPDGLDFCIRTLSMQAPREALEWVKNFLAAVEQPELLSRYVSRLSRGLDLDERELRGGLKVFGAANSGSGPGPAPASGPARIHAHDAFDRAVLKFLVRYPHRLPVLRDAGAMLLLTPGWAITLWEKVAACAPEDFHPDAVLRRLGHKEKEFWGRSRVMEAPPPEHHDEELADILAMIARRCHDQQAGACMQALRQTGDKGDYDVDLLKALNETLIRQRTIGSSDG